MIFQNTDNMNCIEKTLAALFEKPVRVESVLFDAGNGPEPSVLFKLPTVVYQPATPLSSASLGIETQGGIAVARCKITHNTAVIKPGRIVLHGNGRMVVIEFSR